MITTDINVICPDNLKLYLIQNRVFNHAHYFSKKNVLDSAFYTYEKEDVLSYALNRNVSFAIAKKNFESFHLLTDNKNFSGDESITLIKLRELRDNAITNGYLHKPDYMNQYALKSRPVIIIGYTKNDYDLISAFKSLNIDISNSFKEVKDFLNVYHDNFIEKVILYGESWIEVLEGLNWLCSEVSNDIKGGKVDFADYQIVCPSSYFSIVKNTASLFNLPVSVPIDCVRNIKEVKEFINDVKGGMSLDDLAIKASLIRNTTAQSAIIKVLSTIYTLKKKRNIDLPLNLLVEYLESSLSSAIDFDDGIEGISVVDNLVDLVPSKHLLVLGFSDALVSVSKDNGMIADAYKRRFTYEQLSTEENKSKELIIKDNLSLSQNVRMSRAANDCFQEYPKVFFLKGSDWISEIDNSINEYDSYGSVIGEGRKDLSFYHSILHNRYDSVRYEDDMAEAISKNAKGSANVYCSYDNDFDSDEETQEYFRNYFEENSKIELSHTSLDCYMNNPFSYYCKNILKLKGSSNFTNIAGQLIHAHAEERDLFDFDKTVDNLLNGARHPIPEIFCGMNRNQLIYFLKNADLNFTGHDLGILKKFEETCGWEQIRPEEGDEFTATIDMPMNSSIRVFYDQVYRSDNDYVLVDYKTSSSTTYYVNRTNSLLGRMLQLPLYSVVFDRVMKANGMKTGDLIGSYICRIPYSAPYDLDYSGIITGYSFKKDYLPIKEDFQEAFGIDNVSKNTDFIKNLSDEKVMLTSKNDISKEGVKYNLICKIQDFITKDLTFGAKSDSLYPNGSPSTDGLGINDRIKSATLTSYFYCLKYLREGRLTDKDNPNRIKWFPVYPTYVYYNGSNKAMAEDDYPDISFTRPYQKHEIVIADFDESTLSSVHGDYDGMKMPDGGLIDDEVKDDAIDDATEDSKKEN